MFSGKSEEMVRQLRRAEIAHRRALVVRPTVDTRAQTEAIVSRSGFTFPSRMVTRSAEIEPIVRSTNPDVIAIDEAQFFDSELPVVVERLVAGGRHVIAAGLDTDFLGRPFGPMPQLLALADDVRKLTAICVVCGAEATRTQRLIDGHPASPWDPLIVVGGMGDEVYQARCRTCHAIGPADRPPSRLRSMSPGSEERADLAGRPRGRAARVAPDAQP
jgi:thymidine kinase